MVKTSVTIASCKGLRGMMDRYYFSAGPLTRRVYCLLVSVVQGVLPVTTRQPAEELFTARVIQNAITEQQ